MVVENRGGFRPNAPQNQTGVSAKGGNGSKNGQPTRLAPGGKWGERAAMATQQAGGAMKNAQSTSPATPTVSPSLAPLTPITAMSERSDEPITTGVNIGAGAGQESLALPGSDDLNQDKQRLLSYLPALEVAAQSPTSSQAFRNYVRVLRVNLQ